MIKSLFKQYKKPSRKGVNLFQFFPSEIWNMTDESTNAKHLDRFLTRVLDGPF